MGLYQWGKRWRFQKESGQESGQAQEEECQGSRQAPEEEKGGCGSGNVREDASFSQWKSAAGARHEWKEIF